MQRCIHTLPFMLYVTLHHFDMVLAAWFILTVPPCSLELTFLPTLWTKLNYLTVDFSVGASTHVGLNVGYLLYVLHAMQPHNVLHCLRGSTEGATQDILHSFILDGLQLLQMCIREGQKAKSR